MRPVALRAWRAPLLVALSLLPMAAGAAQRGRSGPGGLAGWIQEDIERGLQVARTSGKPLMIVFRCPP